MRLSLTVIAIKACDMAWDMACNAGCCGVLFSCRHVLEAGLAVHGVRAGHCGHHYSECRNGGAMITHSDPD